MNLRGILEPCGLVMDYLNRTYTAQMRISLDPDQVVTVRWYPAPPGAQPFPIPHPFGSSVWEANDREWPQPGLGEVDLEREGAPKAFTNAKGQAPGSPLEWFTKGVPRYALENPAEYLSECVGGFNAAVQDGGGQGGGEELYDDVPDGGGLGGGEEDDDLDDLGGIGGGEDIVFVTDGGGTGGGEEVEIVFTMRLSGGGTEIADVSILELAAGDGFDIEDLGGGAGRLKLPISGSIAGLIRDSIGIALAGATTSGMTIDYDPDTDTFEFTNDVTQYTGEMAQDAAGGMATSTARIALTYDDALATLSADLVANSVAASYLHASATDTLFGRSSAGAGAGEEIACTAFGRSLIDDTNAAAARTTLGLGTLAVLDSVPSTAFPTTVPTLASITPGPLLQWGYVDFSHTDFQAAATAKDIEIYSAPAGTILHHAAMRWTTTFSGGAIANYIMSVGRTAALYSDIITTNDVKAAVGAVASPGIPSSEPLLSATATVSVRARAQSTGANLNASTQGVIRFFLLVSKLF